MSKAINRRHFLKTSAVAASGALLAAPAARALGANDRIRVGIIGLGVRGNYHSKSLADLAKRKLANVEIAAISELWKPWREAAAGRIKDLTGTAPQSFVRYPDMFEKGGVDAVVITTPDFWHVPVLLDAIKAGKDVYIEKPLCVKFEEAKAARDTVKASDRVVQCGTQRRSEKKFQAARDFVRSGKLGKISVAEGTYCDNGPRWRREKDCKAMQLADFDWEFYTRHLPERPFDPRQVLEWKLFREFTMGTAGLLGCHLFDTMQFMLDAPLPDSAVAQGGVYVYKDGRNVEDTFEALIAYPQEFVLRYGTHLGNGTGTPMTLYGTNGVLDAEHSIFSGKGAQPGKNRLPAAETKLDVAKDGPHDHMLNFLECMGTRQQPIASIDAGFSHAVTSLLAQEAMYAGRRLRYDAEKDAIV